MKQSRYSSSISRREVLTLFSTFPVEVFSQRSANSSTEVVEHLTQAVTTCWRMSKGEDLPLVELILPHVLSPLEHFATTSSFLRQRAAQALSQGYQLAGILALHQQDSRTREQLWGKGVQWSKEAKDPSLLVAALTKFGSSFYYSKQPVQALHIYTEALHASTLASPLARSSLHVKLAHAYAQCGRKREAQEQLNAAETMFPAYPEQDPTYVYGDYAIPSLFMWQGMTHLALGEPQRALDSYSLAAQGPAVSKRNALKRQIQQAEAAIALREQDLFVDSMKTSLVELAALDSGQRRQEAQEAYQQAKQLWPQDRQVRELADLFSLQL